MATITGNNPYSNSTDALFRTWAAFVASCFASWTDTAATGQIVIASATRPTVAGTSAGFKVYAMADALQATAPVFVRVDFMNAAVNVPQIKCIVGTTHDGAGTIGNIVATTFVSATNDGGAVTMLCFGSHETNRSSIAMYVDSVGAVWHWSIERTKDSSGADTGTGLLLNNGSGNSVVNRSYYLPFTGPIPALQTGFHIILSQTTPSTLNGNVGVSAIVPMGYDAKQPGLNNCVCLVNDFANYASLPITLYGVSHTYKQCGPYINYLRAAQSGASSDASTRLLMRYE